MFQVFIVIHLYDAFLLAIGGCHQRHHKNFMSCC